MAVEQALQGVPRTMRATQLADDVWQFEYQLRSGSWDLLCTGALQPCLNVVGQYLRGELTRATVVGL